MAQNQTRHIDVRSEGAGNGGATVKTTIVGMLIWLGALAAGAPAYALDVTTAKAREQNLLEYIAGRSDLSSSESSAWERAVRLTFGGKAMKDGTDEGVTVAKSVISGAIFFGVTPDKGAKAAYDAYHDTYSWVPPPLAINYQLLAFQGRRPNVSAKRLAFGFQKYFNEELAPDIVVWWAQMLDTGKIAEWERPEIERLLAETREMMRPMLLDMLWRGAELEARRQVLKDRASRGEVEDALATLKHEIDRSFRRVAHDRAVDEGGSFYERYLRLAKELGETAKPRPRITVGPSAPPPPKAKPIEPPKIEATKPPKIEPSKPPKVEPKPLPPAVPLADAETARRQEERRRSTSRIPAPLPGDPLVALFSGWRPNFGRVVQGWVGVPYLWGGLTKEGIDCSAFVREVFRESFNVELPRNSRAQHKTGKGLASQDELEPGDLIFFDTLDRGQVTHVGVYLGDGEFAHASSSRGVTPAPLKKKYYQRAYWGGRRLLQR